MNFAEGMEAALVEEARLDGNPDAAAAFWREGAPDVPFEDVAIPGGAGQDQPARLYGTGTRTLLYIHGGGWAGGSVALNESSALHLAAKSGWRVLAPSYRFAPEHPYPAALDDCRAALRWLEGQGGPIAVGGVSAGGNLAMALALSEPRETFAGLLLVYGVLGADFSTGSYEAFAEGPGLTRARMVELFEMYDPDHRRDSDPLITPLLETDLSGLPPAFLIAAGIDPLLDDSCALANRLAEAGNRGTYLEVAGVTHGFINRGRLVPAAPEALSDAADFLKALP